MKKLIPISVFSAVLGFVIVFCTGQVANISPSRTISIPTSTLPVYRTMSPTYRLLGLDTNLVNFPVYTNFTIGYNDLLSSIQTVLVTNTIFSTQIIQSVAPLIDSKIEGGYILQPAVQNVASNIYWWDFGLTNNAGLHYIYAALQATNDTVFPGPTNCFQWGLLSYDVVATGTERIWVLSNSAVQFNTNDGAAGWYYSNGWWVLFLSNGNIFRDTIQSNIVLEHQWITKGQ